MAEYSEYLCVNCGTKLMSYYPREIESFLVIKDEDFDRDKTTYRCNRCKRIFQMNISSDADGYEVFDIKCFVIEKEDEKDDEKDRM